MALLWSRRSPCFLKAGFLGQAVGTGVFSSLSRKAGREQDTWARKPQINEQSDAFLLPKGPKKSFRISFQQNQKRICLKKVKISLDLANPPKICCLFSGEWGHWCLRFRLLRFVTQFPLNRVRLTVLPLPPLIFVVLKDQVLCGGRYVSALVEVENTWVIEAAGRELTLWLGSWWPRTSREPFCAQQQMSEPGLERQALECFPWHMGSLGSTQHEAGFRGLHWGNHLAFPFGDVSFSGNPLQHSEKYGDLAWRYQNTGLTLNRVAVQWGAWQLRPIYSTSSGISEARLKSYVYANKDSTSGPIVSQTSSEPLLCTRLSAGPWRMQRCVKHSPGPQRVCNRCCNQGKGSMFQEEPANSPRRRPNGQGEQRPLPAQRHKAESSSRELQGARTAGASWEKRPGTQAWADPGPMNTCPLGVRGRWVNLSWGRARSD